MFEWEKMREMKEEGNGGIAFLIWTKLGKGNWKEELVHKFNKTKPLNIRKIWKENAPISPPLPSLSLQKCCPNIVLDWKMLLIKNKVQNQINFLTYFTMDQFYTKLQIH